MIPCSITEATYVRHRDTSPDRMHSLVISRDCISPKVISENLVSQACTYVIGNSATNILFVAYLLYTTTAVRFASHHFNT